MHGVTHCGVDADWTGMTARCAAQFGEGIAAASFSRASRRV